MTDNVTLFSKIISREIPATIVYENEHVLAFKDIHPQAPVHILVIPKTPVRDVLEADATLLGHVMAGATQVARQEGLESSGFRIVINTGEGAGQSVFHLHAHVLGGRDLSWPPG
jgi:histidine triad (HIT) family protein